MKKLVFIFFLISSNILTGQVTQEWVATYSGTGVGYNTPRKSGIDIDGNYIVAGSSDSTNGYDYIILKYNPSGILLWKQRYNGLGNSYDYLTGMVLDDSGNIYVTGESNEGTVRGGINWVTIKYNSNGQMLWKRSLNWTANNTDEPFGMNIDNHRNIYVVGFGKTSSIYRQMITIKYSSDGDSLWAKVYRSSLTTHDWGYSVVTDDYDNVYSSGYGIIPTGNEIVTIKYDTQGNEKWIKKYPTYYGDFLRPTFSAIDSSLNLVVVGYSYTENSDYDFVTLKYSPYGELLWSRIFDRGLDDYANSLCLDKESNILIGGSTVDSNFQDYLILKYSTGGNLVLLKTINGEASVTDVVYSVISDSMKNIYVTGFTQSFSNHFDYLTIKMNQSGKIIWSIIYRSLYDNDARCINLDNNGCIYVSGSGGSSGGNSGIVSIKYSQLTGIIISERNIVDEFQLSNFPNPSNSNTEIIIRIPKGNFVKVTVYDISGKEIETLFDEFKYKGEYKFIFNGNRYSSGIYFYSLIFNGTIVKSNRMLIIK